jgi:hypothetical protein
MHLHAFLTSTLQPSVRKQKMKIHVVRGRGVGNKKPDPVHILKQASSTLTSIQTDKLAVSLGSSVGSVTLGPSASIFLICVIF